VSGLAVMLIAMGIADMCRRLTDRIWPPVVAAPVVVVVCAALAGLWRASVTSRCW
jgi:xanthine/uracil permease